MIVENEEYKSYKEIISDTIALFIDGRETTGFTLGTSLMLAKKVAEKLRLELLSLDELKRSSLSGYLFNAI